MTKETLDHLPVQTNLIHSSIIESVKIYKQYYTKSKQTNKQTNNFP